MENRDMTQWSPAEHKIHSALQEVEKMGAHILLTEAVTLIGKAKEAVAKFLASKGAPVETPGVAAPTVGRIVHFYSGTRQEMQLPNSMPYAPAIVTQVFGPRCNMTIFVAETDPTKPTAITRWSVPHKDSKPTEDSYYWDWPPKA